MEDKVLHCSDKDFETKVEKASGPSVVDFWAPWCGPCRALAPLFEEAAAAYGDRVSFVKVNVDECPRTAARFGIRSIPTVLFVEAGKVKETSVGLMSKGELAAFIERNMRPQPAPGTTDVH